MIINKYKDNDFSIKYEAIIYELDLEKAFNAAVTIDDQKYIPFKQLFDVVVKRHANTYVADSLLQLADKNELERYIHSRLVTELVQHIMETQ